MEVVRDGKWLQEHSVETKKTGTTFVFGMNPWSCVKQHFGLGGVKQRLEEWSLVVGEY